MAIPTISTTIIGDPPPALALDFVPALPAGDRDTSKTSWAFPLAYYPSNGASPSESVQAPVSPPEVFNQVTIETQSSAWPVASGSPILAAPDYVTYISGAGNIGRFLSKQVLDEVTYFYQNFSSIGLSHIDEDSSGTWFPVIRNGCVFRDITIDADEIDMSNPAVTGHINGSWLRSAGLAAGDRVRLIYTLPQQSLWFNYEESGVRSVDGDREYIAVSGAEGLHVGGGDIVLDSTNIKSIQRISELSVQGERLLFSGNVSEDTSTSTYRITQWDGKNGRLRFWPAPSDGAVLSVDYTKESLHTEYRGFYDEAEGLWQSLDLNPGPSHTYNSGVDLVSRNNRPTEELIYRPIGVYLLPTGAYKIDEEGNPLIEGGQLNYYSAYAQGGRTRYWHPLRHYVSPLPKGSSSQSTTLSQIATWGYAVLDSSVYAEEIDFSAAERGIPKELESAILIARIRVRPRSKTTAEDARRFSGLSGEYDRRQFLGASSDKSANRWDISPWEGLSAPLAGTVVVEVSSDIISREGMDTVDKAVKDSLPPGIVAVIRAKNDYIPPTVVSAFTASGGTTTTVTLSEPSVFTEVTAGDWIFGTDQRGALSISSMSVLSSTGFVLEHGQVHRYETVYLGYIGDKKLRDSERNYTLPSSWGVVNNSLYDVTAPTLSVNGVDYSGLRVVFGFSEPVTGSVGYTAYVNSVSRSYTITQVNSTDFYMDFATPVKIGDVVTLDYVPGDVTDLSGLPLAGFTGRSVPNFSEVP